MPPVGLLAIAALGMVLAYILPQRIRERGEYAMVRTEDRYSADMRVIRSSAERATRAQARPSTDSAETPLLVTGAARASVTALGDSSMSRPAAPLDKAATVVRRQAVSMRRDRASVLAERAAQARRRGTVGVLAFLATAATWGLVGTAIAPTWSAVAASTVLGGVTVAGRRAVSAQRRADATLIPVAREVATAAAATSALQRLMTDRASGKAVAPSIEETQAIRVLTAVDLVPATEPAELPAPELPGRVADPGWTPEVVPAPTYTLKPAAASRTPRPITEEDLAASARAATRAADKREADEATRKRAAAEDAHPSTATLDAILARRRQQTA